MAEPLEQFIETVTGTSHLRVEHDFGDGFVRLQTSEAERRQAAQDIRSSEDIVLELLRNSRDAHATHIFVASSHEDGKRLITVIDDGDGIPKSMHDLVFEPRVTSKLDTSHMDAWGMHGRGMALYSISVNAQSARIVNSSPDKGCALHVETDTSKLTERRDQSSFPTFEMGENSTVSVRGPKNILRTICEFAIDCRNTCSVYVGSPAEISATLYEYGRATLPAIDRLFCRDVESIPIPKRLALAGDPASLAEAAEEAGLSISERTARRILDGAIGDVDSILERITIHDTTTSAKKNRARTAPVDGRSFKLQAVDADALGTAVKEAFADIADRYYLEANVQPSVKVRRDRLTITIPVVKLS